MASSEKNGDSIKKGELLIPSHPQSLLRVPQLQCALDIIPLFPTSSTSAFPHPQMRLRITPTLCWRLAPGTALSSSAKNSASHWKVYFFLCVSAHATCHCHGGLWRLGRTQRCQRQENGHARHSTSGAMRLLFVIILICQLF